MIILLVIVIMGIVWAVVLPLIQNTTSELSVEGFTSELEIKNLEYDELTGILDVEIRRGAGKGFVKEIAIIVDGNRTDVDSKDIEELETKTYEVDLGINSEEPTEVSIAPVFDNGIGDIEDSELLSDFRY